MLQIEVMVLGRLLRAPKLIINRYFGGIKGFLIWLVILGVVILVFKSFLLRASRLLDSKTVDSGESLDDSAGGAFPHGPPGSMKDNWLFPDLESSATEKTNAKTGFKCDLEKPCEGNEYAYYVRSAIGKNIGPSICWNGDYIVSNTRRNWSRGLMVVVINDETKRLVEIKHFDTYLDDAAFVRYLKLVVADSHLILAASADEMSYNFHEDARAWMMRYGSKSISQVKFRDTFVILGQRGLASGSAIEKLVHRGSEQDFADPAEIKGCISIPVGPLKKIQVTKPQIGDRSSMMTGKELANCGLRHACGPNTFPVHMFTGKQKRSDAGPKICVNGKYVLAEGINDAGRGFNIAVIDPVEIEVIRVGHFDTYAEDSSHLEIFLEMITEGEIILAITYDDAARKLSDHAKHLLNELGSAQVQNMRFRDNWYFIGQKGVDGFVDREQLEYSGIRHEWPNVIDKRMCVPTKLQGFKIKPDPLTSKNPKRREFCTKYEGYDDFCDVNHMDELLAPAPLTDRALQGHVVFLTPIAVVIKDMTGKALQMLLDTILMQPGVDPKIVYVMHDKEHPDAGDMASVYGFHSVLLDSLETFPDYMNQGMDKIWSLFPKKSYVMMIEEAVVLSPDYLYFMAQILPMLKQDETLIGISAWNPNGYEGVSSNISLLYRIETIPGLAFLMKRTFYERKLKGRLKKCCRRRSWEVWKFSSGMEDYEMVVPDISRVQHLPVVQPSKLEAQLFNRKRVVNLEPRPELAGVRSIIADRYEEEIFRLIRDSKPMSMAHLKPCRQALAVNNPLLHLPGAGKVYVLYFNQRSSEDYTVVALLCKCSGLFFVEGVDPFGLHKGMLRFTLKNNVILFIGSASPYFVYKPPSTEPIGNEFFTGNER